MPDLRHVVASFLLLAATAAGAQSPEASSRLFFVPTAQPLASGVEVGTRALVVPSIEVGLGRAVSVAASGVAFPNTGGGMGGTLALDARVGLVQRERIAFALGLTALANPFDPTATGETPASAHIYGVGTASNRVGSLTAGLGVRVAGRQERPAVTPCPRCDSYAPGPGTYRVRAFAAPLAFGGGELRLVARGETRYGLIAEGMAVPVRGIRLVQTGTLSYPTGATRYTLMGSGGLRVQHRRVQLDLGLLGVSSPEGSGRRTEPGLWVGIQAGF